MTQQAPLSLAYRRWLERHRASDPHCTCNDCIAYEQRQETDMNDRIDDIDNTRPAPRIARTPEERFQWAGSAAAAPEVTPGATICNTPEAIERFRQIALLHSLKLQSVGIKTHRGSSALTIARAHYGITSRKADKAYAELRAKMIAAGVIAEETR